MFTALVVRSGSAPLFLALRQRLEVFQEDPLRHGAGQVDMVAGAVAPARLELGNEELLRAHIHSLWLSSTGISLGRDMTKVLDLETPGFLLVADVEHRLNLPPAKFQEAVQEGQRILSACGDEVRLAAWYRDSWVEETLKACPEVFNLAFNRWRELFSAAVRQRDDNQRIANKPTASRDERNAARQRIAEAEREIDLLLNRSEESIESDFYPYRYLASEGFLPGYNFPRLPLRALVPTSDGLHIIDRPRFLGLPEFGPRNVIYHEGRKYRMARCVLPPGGVESRLVQAKFCLECGYFHDREHALEDRCEHCGGELDSSRSVFVPRLFEMSTVKGWRVERITCDEEERVREGFEIDTFYRFAPGPDGLPVQQVAVARDSAEHELMRLTCAPQADLWRVNQKWRRSEHSGFTLDAKTGYWARRPGDDDKAPDVESQELITSVRPFVRDTRNLLLVQPSLADGNTTDEFLTTLAYALQRGIQVLFQVEQQEIAVEQIGEDDQRRILFWEAAEGGNGIWQRLIDDSETLSRIAAAALKVCHFGENGSPVPEWESKCSKACYDCLLSYSNQPKHASIDRHLIREYLLRLAGSRTTKQTTGRAYDEQYAWLEERRDQNSKLEGELLRLLYDTRRRLPDRAQYRPVEDVFAEADFYYERRAIPGACVFCDGPDHDQPNRQDADKTERGKLSNAGYRVVVIRHDKPLEEQVVAFTDVFGPGVKAMAVY